MSHDGKIFLEGAKTKAGIRTIPLPQATVNLLKKQKSILLKEKRDFGEGYSDLDLVICTSLGTPLTPANLRRSFNRLIKEDDATTIRFHDLRHSHATLLLSKGVNVKVISERLGHSNIKVTLDIYSHILPTMQQDAINKLDAILN